MFTKKNGLMVRFVALIVMIVMVAAVGLTACADKDAQAAAENAQNTANDAVNAITDLTATIEELQKALEALKKADSDTLAALEDLKNALESADKDNAAADELANDKIDELDAYVDAYDFTFYSPKQLAAEDELFYDAWCTIIRAKSEAAMDKAIADYKAALAELPTIDEELTALVEAIKANGINSPEDDTNVIYAKSLVKIVVDGYAADAVKWGEMHTKLSALITEFNNVIYPTWAKAFIKVGAETLTKDMLAINALPTALSIKPEADRIQAAFDEWTTLANDPEYCTNYDEAVAAVPHFKNAIAEFTYETQTRLAELVLAKAEIDEKVNNVIVLLAADVKPTAAFKAQVEALYPEIDAWAKKYTIEDDITGTDYIEENYKLANKAGVDELLVAFAAKVEATRTEFKKFTAAVDAVGKVTNKSYNAIKAAYTAYEAAKKATGYNGFDEALKVEGEKTFEEYYNDLYVMNGVYTGIMQHEAAIKTLVDTHKGVKFQAISSFATATKQTEYETALAAAVAAIDQIEALVEKLTTPIANGGHGQDTEAYPDANTKAAIANIELVNAKYTTHKEVETTYATYIDGETDEVKLEKLLGVKNVLNDLVINSTTVEQVAEYQALIAKYFADAVQ